MTKFLKWFIILIPAIIVVIALVIFAATPNKTEKNEKEVQFNTKDNRVTFTAYESYKTEDRGEFDLYLNKDNKQVMGVFSYNLNEYEENSSKEILDKQISYYLEKVKDMTLWKKEAKYDMEDKIITKVEYTGKTDNSDECIYIFASIDFKTDANYVLYIQEVITKKNYEAQIGEMNNILKSAKLN